VESDQNSNLPPHQDGDVPPRGWERPREHGQEADSDSLAQLVEQLLALVPEELRGRLTEALHQLLEAVRALIDWCVARLEHRASAEVEVHDIPIL
jgi:predicted TPR repeat methyltransferase